MLSWIRPSSTKTAELFKDSFRVIELDQVCGSERVQLDQRNTVFLYSNVYKTSEKLCGYYEVVYRKTDSFAFLVFHNTVRQQAVQMWSTVSTVLNDLDRYLTTNKLVVADHLSAIMNCLRVNDQWTTAHVCARIGFDAYFVGASDHLPSHCINAQIQPDRDTPLHLAIKSFRLATVKAILVHEPNLDLLNANQQSVLHYAAISTQEIALLLLNKPGMFDRITWKDSNALTALHLACFIKKFDIVFEFLKFGLTVRMLTLSPPCATPANKSAYFPNGNQDVEDGKQDEIVHFTEQDFDDLDCQDIFAGGSPLHWVKHKRLMDKLLGYGFPFNSRNLVGETALHLMAKRLRLKCVLSLLCAGANVNAINIFGNTPLHFAVKKNELVVPQTLIVFDANIDAKNFNNESVRHVAAQACKSTGNEAILYLLSALGAQRCPSPDNSNARHTQLCTNGCSASGDFEGNINEKLFGVDQKYDRLFKDFLFGDIIRERQSATPEKVASEKWVNMLCLDGGGVRGLISLQMLKEVERYLRHPLASYFKWYAGTSTGSFIVTFLSMGKTLNQIRAIYFRLKDQVLTGAKPYLSESFERVIVEEVGQHIQMDELRTRFGKYVIIPSVIANRRPMKLHLFRSFPSAQELFEASGQANLEQQFQPDRDKDLRNYKRYESRRIEVWKACRASGAAPTYFRAYGDFLDGGLVANNPTLDAMAEFEQHQRALRALGRAAECDRLGLVLSIGTGKGMLTETEMVDIANYFSVNTLRQSHTLVNLIIYEVCQTEQHVIQRAESYCSAAGVPYFRLNTFLSDVMELDEQQDYKIIQCLWETKRFMYYRREQVKVLVNYLENCITSQPNNSTR